MTLHTVRSVVAVVIAATAISSIAPQDIGSARPASRPRVISDGIHFTSW